MIIGEEANGDDGREKDPLFLCALRLATPCLAMQRGDLYDGLNCCAG